MKPFLQFFCDYLIEVLIHEKWCDSALLFAFDFARRVQILGFLVVIYPVNDAVVRNNGAIYWHYIAIIF